MCGHRLPLGLSSPAATSRGHLGTRAVRSRRGARGGGLEGRGAVGARTSPHVAGRDGHWTGEVVQQGGAGWDSDPGAILPVSLPVPTGWDWMGRGWTRPWGHPTSVSSVAAGWDWTGQVGVDRTRPGSTLGPSFPSPSVPEGQDRVGQGWTLGPFFPCPLRFQLGGTGQGGAQLWGHPSCPLGSSGWDWTFFLGGGNLTLGFSFGSLGIQQGETGWGRAALHPGAILPVPCPLGFSPPVAGLDWMGQDMTMASLGGGGTLPWHHPPPPPGSRACVRPRGHTNLQPQSPMP